MHHDGESGGEGTRRPTFHSRGFRPMPYANVGIEARALASRLRWLVGLAVCQFLHHFDEADTVDYLLGLCLPEAETVIYRCSPQ